MMTDQLCETEFNALMEFKDEVKVGFPSVVNNNSGTSMSRCSSTVFLVKGRVGFVDEGRTFFTPQTLMMSGACPPPAPSL